MQPMAQFRMQWSRTYMRFVLMACAGESMHWEVIRPL